MSKKISFSMGKHNKNNIVNQKINYFYAFNDDSAYSKKSINLAHERTYEELLAEKDVILAMNYFSENKERIYKHVFIKENVNLQGESGYGKYELPIYCNVDSKFLGRGYFAHIFADYIDSEIFSGKIFYKNSDEEETSEEYLVEIYWETNADSLDSFHMKVYDGDNLIKDFGEDFLEGFIDWFEDEELYLLPETAILPEENVLKGTVKSEIVNETISAPAGITSKGKHDYSSISIYRREIWPEGGESISTIVANNSDSNNITDYNIANNRTYEYTIYPHSPRDEQPIEYRFVTETKWNFWTVTELIPTEDKNVYKTSKENVWALKYNVAPSDQVHNISKTQQDNLGAYPVFSRGKKNNISSQITALLGSEIIPWNWKTHKQVAKVVYTKDEDGNLTNAQTVWNKTSFSGENSGGYKETVPFIDRLSSNEKIDLLKKWRDLCYSGNPKLIKDLKGQKFIVQIIDNSNSTNYSQNRMPDTISFSWVEIQDSNKVQIYEER